MSPFPSRVVAYMAGAGVPWLLGIVEALLRQHPGIAVVDFVIGDRPSFRWAIAQGIDSRVRFRYQHEYLRPFKKSEVLDRHRLAQLEERYGLPNLWRYIQAQRMIEHLDQEDKLAYLLAYIEYFELLYNETKAELFITGTPDSLPFMVGCEVFRRNGCPMIAMAPGRLPRRFFVVINELEQIRGLAEEYEGLKLRDLNPEEMQIVKDLRTAYLGKRIRPSYYRLRPRLSAVPSPLRLAKYLHRRFLEDDQYYDYAIWTYVKQAVLYRLREPIQKRRIRRLVSHRIEHERFFYMPLNYEPECSIDVQSGFYRDQISVVQRVVGGLPSDYVLYVKEHPNMLPGARPLDFYQRLVGLGSVRMLPREMDSYEILQRCAGVITIGGTSGVEALFYGKPVMLMGRAFYEVFREGVFRVSGFEAIPLILRQMAKLSVVDETLFDKFVIAVFERSYAGAGDLPTPGALDLENFETIAHGVTKEVRSLLGVA